MDDSPYFLSLSEKLSLKKFGELRSYGEMPNSSRRWWQFWKPKTIPRLLPEPTGEKVKFRRPRS